VPPTASDARAYDDAPVSGPDLLELIRRYADLLSQQAEILEGLPGELGAENAAEAQAYRAVVGDLGRILSGELAESGLVAS
jgi:hypothetical protein